MTGLRHRWAIKGALVVGFATLALRFAGAAEIEVAKRYGTTVASTEVEGCKASLETHPKWHTLSYRNGCPQPLADKVRLFAELMGPLLAGGKLPADVTSLGLGRLVNYPELSARIALLIRASSDWDGEKLRFRGQGSDEPGALNRFFAEMLDRHALLQPFLDALAPHGISAGASSVEKVLVGPPSYTPVPERLLAAGVGPEEKLPFDAMVWLTLRREVQD